MNLQGEGESPIDRMDANGFFERHVRMLFVSGSDCRPDRSDVLVQGDEERVALRRGEKRILTIFAIPSSFWRVDGKVGEGREHRTRVY